MTIKRNFNINRLVILIPGRPGVLAGDKNYQPIDVEIPFYLMAYTADEMEDVHRRFRQGRRGARFEIQADHPLSPLFLDVDDFSLPGLAGGREVSAGRWMCQCVFFRLLACFLPHYYMARIPSQ